MTLMLTDSSNYEDIADAIRSKNGESGEYLPGEMAAAISELPGRERTVVLAAKRVTENGQYAASDDSVDGYYALNVSVTSTYGDEDIGKVVGDGGLVEQTSRTVEHNGTYDTTTNNQVTVSIDYPPSEDVGAFAESIIASSPEIPDNFMYKSGEYQLDVVENAVSQVCESVGSLAFYNCASLLSVDMPACTEVSQDAFCNCTSLASVNLPACTTLGGAAFRGCTSLTSISMPDLTAVGGDAFGQCTALATVSMPNVETVNGAGFANTAIAAANFPKATSIGQGAFQHCLSLQSVTMPLLATVGSWAFAYCETLESISLPSATSIGDYAFNNCYMLETLDLSGVQSVPTLGDTGVFSNTKIEGGSGTILVPASLYEDFLADENWLRHSSHFVVVS